MFIEALPVVDSAVINRINIGSGRQVVIMMVAVVVVMVMIIVIIVMMIVVRMMVNV